MDRFINNFFNLIQEQKEQYISKYPDIPHTNASDANDCLRKVSLKMFKVKKTNVGKTSEVTLHIGNVIDKLAKQAVLNTYKVGKTDVYWFNGFMSGKADAIIKNDNGEKVVVEIKSCNSKTYNFVKKMGSPNTSNYLQATLTAHYFNINKVKLIYICKEYIEDDDGIVIFDLDVDLFQTKFESEKFEEVVKLQQKGIVAERFYDGEIIEDPSKKKFPCAYCSFYNLCINMNSGKMEIGEVLNIRSEMEKE